MDPRSETLNRARAAATKCPRGIACLDCDEFPLCHILTGDFVNSCDDSCPYLEQVAEGDVCTCPVRCAIDGRN